MKLTFKNHFKLVIALLSNFFIYNAQRVPNISIDILGPYRKTKKVVSDAVNLFEKLLYTIRHYFYHFFHVLFYCLLLPCYHRLKIIDAYLKFGSLKYLKMFINCLLKCGTLMNRCTKFIYKRVFEIITYSVILKFLLELSSFVTMVYLLQMFKLIDVFMQYKLFIEIIKEWFEALKTDIQEPTFKQIAQLDDLKQTLTPLKNHVGLIKKILVTIFTLAIILGIISFIGAIVFSLTYQTQIKEWYEFVIKFFERVQNIQQSVITLQQTGTNILAQGRRIMHITQNIFQSIMPFIPAIIFLFNLLRFINVFTVFFNVFTVFFNVCGYIGAVPEPEYLQLPIFVSSYLNAVIIGGILVLITGTILVLYKLCKLLLVRLRNALGELRRLNYAPHLVLNYLPHVNLVRVLRPLPNAAIGGVLRPLPNAAIGGVLRPLPAAIVRVLELVIIRQVLPFFNALLERRRNLLERAIIRFRLSFSSFLEEYRHALEELRRYDLRQLRRPIRRPNLHPLIEI